MKTIREIVILTTAGSLLVMLIFACSRQNGSVSVPGQVVEYSDQSKADQPVMVFDTMVHDFGTLIEGEQVVCYFEYTNEGDGDLIIESIISSCGCTTLKWDREPVKSGGNAVISVLFDSYGREGLQRKTVTVNSNAENPVVRLSIRANIEVKQ